MILACLLSAALVYLLVRWAPEIGLVDRPNARSMHTRLTPRGGGIGFVATWLAGFSVWWYVLGGGNISRSTFVVFLLATAVVATVSLWDDFRSIGAGVRMTFHLACAAAVVAVFGWFISVDIGTIIALSWTGILVTVFWIVGLTNVFNFMDGIDGIAGLQGAVAGTAWCVVGIHLGMPSVSVSGALLAGGCAGFLIHNWSPAKIFMGDVGSAFLGFCFSIVPLVALDELSVDKDRDVIARLPVFAALVVWPFLADGSFTFCRRLLKREPVWKAHRSHLYQRMVQAGLSHTSVASYYGLWAAVCSIAGVNFLCGGSAYRIWCACTLFAVMTWTLTLKLERRKVARG